MQDSDNRLRLLVVDDDDVDRMALHRALKRSSLQFDLSEAQDAKSGTEKIRDGCFDCVFLDYQLPDSDGLALIKHIRAVGIVIPLIALTGQGDEETAVNLMKAGASDYLPKARLSSEVLTRTIQSAIRVAQAEQEVTLANQRLRETNDRLKQQNQELQEQRAQIQRKNLQLAEVSRLKSEFLATMSHELRTPLNAIIGFSQILMRQLKGHASGRQQDMVQRILTNGQHLLELISDILDLSKIEAGRLDIKVESFNLETLVATTVESLQSLADQKNLGLKVDMCLTEPMVINDISRLRQVLTNLLSNAIKFTEVGSVEVIVRSSSFDTVEILVKDTGIGIDTLELPYIFDAFQQVDQSMARRHQGTGLGLAITQLLVNMMQGQITVESELGKGSCFQVVLPRQVSSSASKGQ